MEIKIVKYDQYDQYKEALLRLYLDAFSKGQAFQYLNEKETMVYLQSVFEVGYGLFAIDKDVVEGVLLIAPLSFDRLVPDEISNHFDLRHSVYVVEMMVDEKKRGCGIGRKLLRYFLETVNKSEFHDAFIRVWIENESALGLYKKVGFEECASIVQPKLLADKSGMFNFEKIYLHQKIE